MPKIPAATFSDSPGGQPTSRTTGPRKAAKRPATKKATVKKAATKKTTKAPKAVQVVESTVVIAPQQPIALQTGDNTPAGRLSTLVRDWIGPVTELPAAEATVWATHARTYGFPWSDIATVFGYVSPAAAEAAVRRQLEASAIQLDDSTRGMALTMATDRYDALVSRFLPIALTSPDVDEAVKAAKVVIEAEAKRARILRLDNTGDTHIEQRNVILSTDPVTLVSQLKQIAEGADPLEVGSPL